MTQVTTLNRGTPPAHGTAVFGEDATNLRINARHRSKRFASDLERDREFAGVVVGALGVVLAERSLGPDHQSAIGEQTSADKIIIALVNVREWL